MADPTTRELQLEIKNLKETHMQFYTEVKEMRNELSGKLTSIDASLSALAPVITAHSERFKTVELRCDHVEKQQKGMSDRLWGIALLVFGTIIAGIAGFFGLGKQ